MTDVKISDLWNRVGTRIVMLNDMSSLYLLFWLLILLKRFHGLEMSLFWSDGFTDKHLGLETVWAFFFCLCWFSPWVIDNYGYMDIHLSIKNWTEITNLFDNLQFASYQGQPLLALVIKCL